MKLTHVLDGGAAQRAGLAPGDVIVALEGLRAAPQTFARAIAQRKPGETVRLHAFRRDELFERSVVLDAAPADTCVVGIDRGAGAAARRRRLKWLRG
ncbi:MAG: PDZ domain-containing protein [Burkholderiales bacterium]|nr:PDZ domain-containing protein [Burkholderiales bacterium]